MVTAMKLTPSPEKNKQIDHIVNILTKLAARFDWSLEVGSKVSQPVDLTKIKDVGESPKAKCTRLLKEITDAGPGGQYASFVKEKWQREIKEIFSGVDDEKTKTHELSELSEDVAAMAADISDKPGVPPAFEDESLKQYDILVKHCASLPDAPGDPGPPPPPGGDRPYRTPARSHMPLHARAPWTSSCNMIPH